MKRYSLIFIILFSFLIFFVILVEAEEENIVSNVTIIGYNETEDPSTGGGGSGGGKDCPTRCNNPAIWSCTEWNLCKNNIQTRVCIDLEDCRSSEKPPLIQSCNLVSDIIKRLPKWLEKGCIDLETLDIILYRWKNGFGITFQQLDIALFRFKTHKNC